MRESLVILFICFFSLESYAMKFFGCCCCDDDDIVYSSSQKIERTPLVPPIVDEPIPSDVTVSNFMNFKKYYTADGACTIHIPPHVQIVMREEVRAGRGGWKGVLFEFTRGKPSQGITFTGGSSIIRQNSIIHNDGFLGTIYRNDHLQPFYNAEPNFSLK